VLSRVYQGGGNEVFEVKGKAGTLLVPVVKAFVKAVDVRARVIVVEPPVMDEPGSEEGEP